MRYRIVLVHNLKNNYIRLPSDSALRQAMSVSDASRGLTAFMTRQGSHCQAIKVTPCMDEARGRPIYFGFVGGTSEEANTVEISMEAAGLLGLEDDMLVSVALEYSYEKLNAVELDPLTVDDFEIIEQNSSQIEEQLLNQVGVFYSNQLFVIFLGANGTQIVRLRTIIDPKETSNCFYLTE